jgi:hypothetical protein
MDQHETVEERRERVMRKARETLERLRNLGSETRAEAWGSMPHSASGGEAEGRSASPHRFDPVRRTWRDLPRQQEEPQPRKRMSDYVLERMIERNIMAVVEARLAEARQEMDQVIRSALAVLHDQTTALEALLAKLGELEKHAKATKAHEHEGKGQPAEPNPRPRILN